MKYFGVIAFFLVTLLAAGAQTDPVAVTQTNLGSGTPKPMSLQDCIREALAHNLDVQIERYEPRLSLYDLNSAYSGWDPKFNLSGQHEYNEAQLLRGTNFLILGVTKTEDNTFQSGIDGTLPWGLQYGLSGTITDEYPTYGAPGPEQSDGNVKLDLTQPLLKNFWIDDTRLSIRVAKNRFQYSEQGLRNQIRISATSVADAYYELVFARENVKVQQEALELARTQLDQDRQRSRIGTLAELDVQQDEAQAAKSQASVIEAEHTLSVDENKLKSLLTDDYKAWHDLDIQPSEALTATMQSFNLQDSWNKGMSMRPDLLQSRLDVENAGIRLKFDRNQLYPELDLLGTIGYGGRSQEYSGVFDRIGQGNAGFYSYGAQITMPLGNLGPRNQYRSSKASLQQIALKLKQLEQTIMVSIDDAVKNAESKYQSVEATRQARIYAEAALSAEQKKYDVGKSTTFTVLQLQNSLTAARSDEIRALADYNQALANLAEQEGSTLEQYKIDINPGDTASTSSGKTEEDNTGFVK